MLIIGIIINVLVLLIFFGIGKSSHFRLALTALLRKIISFKSTNKLSSTVVLHATVPAGTKTVSVYFTGADKKRTLLTTVAPTAAGRLCFAINQLGKYELVYN